MNGKNLLENAPVPVQWASWTPRKGLSPEFFIKDNKLKILTNGNPNVYGKFISGEISVSGLSMILFEAAYSCENVRNEEKSIFAMIDFYDSRNKLLERSYADTVVCESANGKAKKLRRKLDVPENAEYVTLEIGVRWQPGAVVEWDNIILEPAGEKNERLVKIATTYKEPKSSFEENLNDMADVINKAGQSNPDVILLSELVYETCYNREHDYTLEEKAQAIPGPLTDTIGEYAKRYNTYIIFSMNEKEESGAIYNTAVIIGRNGEVCGKYRKTHLPLTEAEWGTSPGDTHAVFDLDFGRIGIIICYDQMFPENSRTLALMGAEVIFLPTQGDDEILQRAISRSNGVYTVVSGYCGSVSSRIINPLGEIVNFVPDKDAAYATEQIDLNKRFFTYWMSVGPANGETKVLFQKERMTETYGSINQESYKLKN